MTADRAQLVLVAAAAVALALVPMAAAYLQLAAHDDVRAGAAPEPRGPDHVRALERATVAAAGEVDGEYRWERRGAAVDAVRDALADDVEAVERSRLEDGVAAEVRYNATAAVRTAKAACPGGDNRAFGPCEADRGVVVQERAGETTVLAVAFDVRVTDADGTTEATVVLSATGGRFEGA